MDAGGKGIILAPCPHGLRTRNPAHRPDGWLHSLASLLAVVALAKGSARRHQPVRPPTAVQRLELGQRLLDPLLSAFRSGLREGAAFWKALVGAAAACCWPWAARSD